MNYKFTSRCELDTLELAENIESEKFPNIKIQILNVDLFDMNSVKLFVCKLRLFLQ